MVRLAAARISRTSEVTQRGEWSRQGHRLHIAIHAVGLKFLFSGGLRGFLGGRQAQTGDLLVGGGDQRWPIAPVFSW